MPQFNYAAYIADAASLYKRAYFWHKLECDAGSRVELEKAREHLFWLIEARREGWDPSEFESEFE